MVIVIELGKILVHTKGIVMTQEMSAKILVAAEEAIKNGSRKLRIVYREDSIQGLLDLERLKTAGQIRMHPTAIATAMAVRLSNDWEHDSNRIFVIELSEEFDMNWFVDKMSGNLENIAYCKPRTH